MALDPRKRQKKLAKQRAKRKAKAAEQKQARPGKSSWFSNLLAMGEFELAARAPIYECYVANEVFSEGIGQVIVSRRSASGQIAAGVFLVDAYCLGVKDAFAMLKPREVFDDFVADNPLRLRRVLPEYAKKLVESAVAYARDLGFEPHPDYRLPSKLLNDIDASACETEFTFGKDGKPFFMSGPHDSQARCKKIIDTLERRCGPDGYHFMMALDPFADDDDDDEYEGDWEEAEDDDGESDYDRRVRRR
jgi:hypothetical protein